MRCLSTLLVTAAVATAQSPLTTTFANNNGGAVGGGVYFDLTAGAADVSVCQMGINISGAPGVPGSIDVFTQPGTAVPHTGFVTQLGVSNPIVTAGIGTPTVFTLSTPLTILAGTTVGVGLRANGVAHAYTNGVNAFPVPGNIFANADLTLNAGQASNLFAAASALSPRVVNANIYYTLGAVACPPAATVVSQGNGCQASVASFYEELTTGAFDLSNGSLALSRSPGGYVGQFIPGGALAPIGALGAAAVVPLTDDSSAAVGTVGLTVGSNCWVALGAGNSNAYAPLVATLLSNPATAFYSWKDLDPGAAGSGQVWYEEDGAGSARVTYDGVYSYDGTTAADANYVQFTIDTVHGDVTTTWGAIAALGTNLLVGYSAGGIGADPGPTDISAAAIVVPDVEQLALSLVGVGKPVQGPAAVNYDVTTSNILPSAVLHIGIVGLTRPGLPLALIGAPDCFLNASLDVLVGPAVLGGPASLTWTALHLPANVTATFYGYEFNVQGVVLGTPLNAALGFGAMTSNGLKCTIGGI